MDHPSQYSYSDSIKVSVRIRPPDSDSFDIPCISLDHNYPNTLYLSHASDPSKPFTFDNIFSEFSTQASLFDTIAKPLMISCFQGYNVCIFAYGQTGAGKTFTIMGNESPNEKGLIPRTIDYLFSELPQSQDSNVKVSFLEIYNEQIIDLLDNTKKNLLLREDLKKGVYVENLSEETTIDATEAEELLRKGSRIRHIGSTAMNIESSRSHSVFTILIESKRNINGVFHTKSSKFSFVDLAGSERQRNLEVISGDRLKEGCNINRSLHVLGNVINALVEVSDGKNRHIHYRDSKLTFLLKDSLGGNSKTSVIANINPANAFFQETFSTIKFAKRAKMIKNRAFINEEATGNLENLKHEIKRLKQELASQQFDRMEVKENHEKGKIERLLKKYVENSIEIEGGLQEEIERNKGNLMNYQQNFKEFKGIEQELRLIIELMQEKMRRNGEIDKENALWKENEALKNLMKRMPFLMKLHQENVGLKSEVKRLEEGVFFVSSQQENTDITRNLTQNIDILKEIQVFMKENPYCKPNEEENVKEIVTKEAFLEMERVFQEKIELLNLELMENKPNNEIISQKLQESQENLENAYEKIGILEGDLEDFRSKNIKNLEIIEEMKGETMGNDKEIERNTQEMLDSKRNIEVFEGEKEVLIEEIAKLKEEIQRKERLFEREKVDLKENIGFLEKKELEKELTISQLQQANQTLKETQNLWVLNKDQILNKETLNNQEIFEEKEKVFLKEKESLLKEIMNIKDFEEKEKVFFKEKESLLKEIMDIKENFEDKEKVFGEKEEDYKKKLEDLMGKLKEKDGLFIRKEEENKGICKKTEEKEREFLAEIMSLKENSNAYEEALQRNQEEFDSKENNIQVEIYNYK